MDTALLKNAKYLALAGPLLDHAIIIALSHLKPEYLHSDAYLPAVQSDAGRLIVLVGLVLVWGMKKASKPALYLFTAGFLSNLLTIKYYGHVLDYIPTGFSYINTADLLIVAGCILFARALFISRET